MRCPPPPAYVLPLLTALRSPARALAFSEAQWDRVLRMARAARLHGVLAHAMARLGTRRLPAAVAAQLQAAGNEARFACAMVQYELGEAQRALASLNIDLLLLKGAAYIAQDLECATGRIPADLDLLVDRAAFDRVERALTEAGWRAAPMSDYDIAYYRRWAHQAPPMRAAGHFVELDLHHAILPPRGRRRIDTAKLWRESVRIGDRLRVLGRADQVLHATVHLFVDSDCTYRLRELIDIVQLVEQFRRDDPDFLSRVHARASELGISDALSHASAFARAWLNADWDAPTARGWPAQLGAALIARRLAPPDPDALPPCVDGAHALLSARSLALRLPMHLALLHAASRPLRRAFAAQR